MTTGIFQTGRSKRLGALALLLLTLCTQISAQDAQRNDLRVACFVDHDNRADPSSVSTALGRWTTSVNPDPTRGVTAKIESDSTRWLRSIEQGTHDLYGLFTFQYLELEDPSILRPYLSVVGGHSTTSTFLLLTRRKDRILDISQLRDKRIVVDTSGHGQLPLIWLATKIGETTPAAKIRTFATITPVQGPHRALFPLYFKKADACIITRSAYTEASKLNPNFTDILAETDKSSPLLVSIFAFHRDFPLVPAEKFATNALKANGSRSSRSLFELIERTGVSVFEESSIQAITALHQNYKALFAPPGDKEGALE